MGNKKRARHDGRPIFTVEISARSFRQHETRVVHDLGVEIARAGYTAFAINEVCGGSACRNFVCLPHERVAAFESSAVWGLMNASGKLLSRCDREQTLWTCYERSMKKLMMLKRARTHQRQQ